MHGWRSNTTTTRIAEITRFAEALPAEEYKQLFDERRRVNRSMFKSMTDQQMDDLTHGTVRVALEKDGRVQLLSFEEYCRQASTPL